MTEEIEVRRPVGLSEATWARLEALDRTTREVALGLVSGELQLELDPAAVAADMARRILEAPSADAALDEDHPVGWQQYLDRPVEVLEARFVGSTFDGGPGAYAVVKACDPETGEVLLLTCGASRVMAQLIKLAMEDALPATVRLVQAAKPTTAGYYPLRLVRA